MFGFKRKKEENTTALIPRKESIFTRLASFFKIGNKTSNEQETYSNQSFYSKNSYVTNSLDSHGHEVFYGTVSTNGLDIYSFQKIKELGRVALKNGEYTKLIVADLNQSYNQEGLEASNLRKICFEIPTYYSLEEFLYSDGLYQLIQSGRVALNNLNYYEVTPVGRVDMQVNGAMQTNMTIAENTPEAIAYASKVLSRDWLDKINRDRKEYAKLKKQADKKMIDDMYEQAFIDEENFKKREDNEQTNRINDNNIRVAPGKDIMYFTDPDTGKIILLDKIVKINTVVHLDNQTSSLYIANYSAKRKFDDVENLAEKNNIAFELSEDDMNILLTNTDNSLNLAFRTLFSELNVNQYLGNSSLGDKHIGYLKKMPDGYKIFYGNSSSRNYLNSLNLELYNSQPKTTPTYFGNGEGR